MGTVGPYRDDLEFAFDVVPFLVIDVTVHPVVSKASQEVTTIDQKLCFREIVVLSETVANRYSQKHHISKS